MPTTYDLPLPTTEASAATRQQLELLASARVSANILKIALLCSTLANAGLLVFGLKAIQVVRQFKPIVIRLDELGRPKADRYEQLLYQPQEAEVKYFLAQFVTHYYGRLRSTVRENYTQALYFLETPLARALAEANKKSQAIENFLASASEEIDIDIKNVAIEDLRSAPYKATVDFEKIYYTAFDHQETKRERYTATFVFTVKDRVPNAMILVNPLGFAISYFHEDQAFR